MLCTALFASRDRLGAGVFILCLVSALCCKPTLGQNAEVTLESQFQPVAGYHLYANMWASGNLAVIGSDQTNGVLIVDITNPLQPVELADYSPANSADMEDVQISGTVGFFASNTDDGVHLVDLSNPSNPTLITRLSSSQNGFDHIHNLFVDSNNTLYEADELTPVVKVFDVSNPANPVWLADITTHDKFVVASITVQNNRLYTAGWGGTTDIYDVTNIKTQPPVWLGSIASGFGTHSCWPTADGAYLAVTREVLNGDVRIYNISNPSSPVLVADLFPSTFGITAAAPSNPWIVGNRLYLSWDQAGVVVLDISNPSAPALLGTYCTWSGPYNPSMYDGAWGIAPALSASQVMATDRNGGMFTVDTSSSGSQLVPFSIILPAGVRPGATATGTVYLCGGPAPAGGAAINLSVNSSSAVVRNSVTIPQGSNRANFWIKGAISVTTPTPVTVTATYNGVAAAGSTTITPPSLESVVFTSTSIAGGAGGSATGKVLFSAPVASSTVVSLNVASGASAVSALPATVTVPAGATGASFTMSTTVVAAPIDVSVTGTAGTVSQTGQVSVTPPTAVSLSASPNPVIGGRAANLTINLSDTATAPVTVSLTSYCRQITFAGGGSSATVTVPAGRRHFTVPVLLVSNPVQWPTTAVIKVTGSFAVWVRLQVLPISETSLTFSPSTVTCGGSVTGVVTLNGPAPVDTTLALSVLSGASAVGSMPSTVTVHAGSSSASFTVQSAGVATSTTPEIAATLNGASQTAGFTVQTVAPAGVTVSPSSLPGGEQADLTITLGSANSVDEPVTVSSGDPSITIGGASSDVVTIPAGNSSYTFYGLVSAGAVASDTQVTITVTNSAGAITGTVTVTAGQLVSLSLNPSSAAGGNAVSATVTLSAPAPAGGFAVSLASDNGSASVPATVIVPAGQSTASFSISTIPVDVSTTANITASLSGASQSAALTVLPASVLSVTLSPDSVEGGASATATITLQSPAGPSGVVVSLSSDNPAATPPASVTVPAGSASISFPVATSAVASNTTVNISANANGGSTSGQLTVTPATLVSLALNPTSVVGGSSSQGTVTISSAAPAGGTTITLSSDNGAATVDSSVTIPAGQTSATFTITTTAVSSDTTANITVSLGAGSLTAPLTITSS